MNDERLDRLLDDLLEMPAAVRRPALDELAEEDPALLAAVRPVVLEAERGDPFLEPASSDLETLLADLAADEAVDERLPPGTRIGGFEILGSLGAGGMGEVYRARDLRLGRDVALKMLPAPYARDPDRLTRFRREARLLAAVVHPNVGAIHGVVDDGVDEVLVLELVDGPTLADRLSAAGPRPIGETLQVARQIGEAVAAAHARGIVHRDLKPANIKLTASGTVKVLDFGLARFVDAPPSSLPTQHPPLPSNFAPCGASGRVRTGRPATAKGAGWSAKRSIRGPRNRPRTRQGLEARGGGRPTAAMARGLVEATRRDVLGCRRAGLAADGRRSGAPTPCPREQATPEVAVSLIAPPGRRGALTTHHSRLTPDPPSSLSRPGLIVGTAAYMSPEQARGEQVDHRSDIWSFGCLLYEMLTGVRPFAGDTRGTLVARILEQDPDFSRLPAETPAPLRQLVARCLERDPARRPQDLGEALALVAEAGEGLPGWRAGRVSARLPAAGRPFISYGLVAAATLVAVATSLVGRRVRSGPS